MRRAGLVLLVVAAACAPRPALLARAIAARGGPLGAVVREADVDVRQRFPGRWHWRTAFAVPDRYAWTLATADQPSHFLFDGTVVRAFLGNAPVAEDPSPGAPLRSQARFVAVASLDVLLLPGVQVAETGSSLAVVFPDRDDRYAVTVDDRTLVTAVQGPIDFSPFARGTLVARYDDFRRAADWLLPHRTTYILDGTPLADEHTVAVCPSRTPLPDTAFATPSAVPACP